MMWQTIFFKKKENANGFKCLPLISDEISEQKADMLQVEEGFRGTLLTSGLSVQLCQDIAFSE